MRHGGLISGDQQVRLWLGMLLYVGCPLQGLSNRFFIHLCDFLSFSLCTGARCCLCRDQAAGLFLTQNVYRRLGVGWRGLIPGCNATTGSVD